MGCSNGLNALAVLKGAARRLTLGGKMAGTSRRGFGRRTGSAGGTTGHRGLGHRLLLNGHLGNHGVLHHHILAIDGEIVELQALDLLDVNMEVSHQVIYHGYEGSTKSRD